MQDPFENHQYIKIYIQFRIYRILYNSYVIGHTLFIYLGFYVAFYTVQVISRRVVRRAEETSTYSSLGFCTVNCRPTASNYQLSHIRPSQGSNPSLRGGGARVLPLCHRGPCYWTYTLKHILKSPNGGFAWECGFRIWYIFDNRVPGYLDTC